MAEPQVEPQVESKVEDMNEIDSIVEVIIKGEEAPSSAPPEVPDSQSASHAAPPSIPPSVPSEPPLDNAFIDYLLIFAFSAAPQCNPLDLKDMLNPPANCLLTKQDLINVIPPQARTEDIKNKSPDEVLALVFDFLEPILCSDLMYSNEKNKDQQEVKESNNKEKAQATADGANYDHSYVYLCCEPQDSYPIKRVKDDNTCNTFIGDIKKNMIPKAWKKLTKMPTLYRYFTYYRNFAIHFLDEAEYDKGVYTKWISAKARVSELYGDLSKKADSPVSFTKYLRYWSALLESWQAFNIMTRYAKPMNNGFKLFIETLIKHPYMPLLLITALAPLKCLFLNIYITQQGNFSDPTTMAKVFSDPQMIAEEATHIVNKDLASRLITSRFKEEISDDLLSKYIRLKFTYSGSSKGKK